MTYPLWPETALLPCPVACPGCGLMVYDYIVHPMLPEAPKEGELMRHQGCGFWVRIVPDGLRAATEEEISDWKSRYWRET